MTWQVTVLPPSQSLELRSSDSQSGHRLHFTFSCSVNSSSVTSASFPGLSAILGGQPDRLALLQTVLLTPTSIHAVIHPQVEGLGPRHHAALEVALVHGHPLRHALRQDLVAEPLDVGGPHLEE